MLISTDLKRTQLNNLSKSKLKALPKGIYNAQVI